MTRVFCLPSAESSDENQKICFVLTNGCRLCYVSSQVFGGLSNFPDSTTSTSRDPACSHGRDRKLGQIQKDPKTHQSEFGQTTDGNQCFQHDHQKVGILFGSEKNTPKGNISFIVVSGCLKMTEHECDNHYGEAALLARTEMEGRLFHLPPYSVLTENFVLS